MAGPKKHSGPLAMGSGALLVIFVVGSFIYILSHPYAQYWFIYVLLCWGLGTSIVLFFWGRGSYKNWQSTHPEQALWTWPIQVGHPTLEMIAGVSGAVAAAVTLALVLLSDVEKTREANHAQAEAERTSEAKQASAHHQELQALHEIRDAMLLIAARQAPNAKIGTQSDSSKQRTQPGLRKGAKQHQ